MTSNFPVWPYRSTTSRTVRRPSLHCVCTWKSQSRKGSYPGMALLTRLHAPGYRLPWRNGSLESGVGSRLTNIDMRSVFGAMVQDFGSKVAHVETEHGALPHRDVPARRGIKKAVVAQFDPA